MMALWVTFTNAKDPGLTHLRAAGLHSPRARAESATPGSLPLVCPGLLCWQTPACPFLLYAYMQDRPDHGHYLWYHLLLPLHF